MEDGVTEIKELISSENNNNNNSLTEHEGEEEKELGGFINNLITNLVSPLSPKSKAEEEGTTTTTTFAEDEKLDTGGGIFSDLISGILHQSEGDKEKDDGNEKVQKQEEVGGDGAGRGLIDNIVSHLPSPLADDAAPATDEASLLIHSIVRD
ncbi:hypothetical protein ACJIZ3_019017 [Penstemon smallii]|uniref:Uncharacterized protein n=1 Tax=Penstemon smallii TaxID=265156 RepID=A0ABD3T0W3_9LAMI